MSSLISGQNGFISNPVNFPSAHSNPQPSLDFTSPPEKLSIDTLYEQINNFKQAIESNQTKTAEKRNVLHSVAANAQNIDTAVLIGCFFELCSLPKEQIKPVIKEISLLTTTLLRQQNEQTVFLEKLKKFNAEKMGLNDVDKQRRKELINKVNDVQREICKTWQNIKEKELKLLCRISVLDMDQDGQKMTIRLKALTEEYKKRGFQDA